MIYISLTHTHTHARTSMQANMEKIEAGKNTMKDQMLTSRTHAIMSETEEVCARERERETEREREANLGLHMIYISLTHTHTHARTSMQANMEKIEAGKNTMKDQMLTSRTHAIMSETEEVCARERERERERVCVCVQ